MCLVLSTRIKVDQASGVGGSLSHLETVTSGRLLVHHLGQTCWYCPDIGAGVHGVRLRVHIII